jgi:hypothetical protein
MIKPLMKALQTEGFDCVSADSGFVVRVPSVTIVVGKDPDHDSFMVSIEDNRGEEPESTSFDKLNRDDVLSLCAPYKQAQPVEPAETIETPLVVG